MGKHPFGLPLKRVFRLELDHRIQAELVSRCCFDGASRDSNALRLLSGCAFATRGGTTTRLRSCNKSSLIFNCLENRLGKRVADGGEHLRVLLCIEEQHHRGTVNTDQHSAGVYPTATTAVPNASSPLLNGLVLDPRTGSGTPKASQTSNTLASASSEVIIPMIGSRA